MATIRKLAPAAALTLACLLLASSAGASSVNLVGAPSFRLDATSFGDYMGSSVDGIGDFNGDGRDDVAIGVPQTFNPSPQDAAGVVYVIFGPRSPTRIRPSSLGPDSVAIQGQVGDELGEAVSAAGDVNGDGYDDVVVSAYSDLEAYVVFGSPNPPPTIDVATLGSAGFRISRGIGVGFRDGVGAAGDVNQDGYSDVLVGDYFGDNNGRTQSGSVYVVYGEQNPTDVDFDFFAGEGFRIDGAAAGDNLGQAVGGAGDVNDDGYPDVVVGALYAGNNGRQSSGSAYVVYGGPAPANVDLASLATGAGFRMDGAIPEELLGAAAEGIGDQNGDGFDDVVVGAPQAGPGFAYVVYGAANHDTLDLNNVPPGVATRITGAVPSQWLGESVNSAGDVNADGTPDIILGAPCLNGCFSGNDAAYTIFGGQLPPSIDVANLGAQGIEFIDVEPISFQDGLGMSVGGAGNFDSDPADEVVIGEPITDNSSSTGSAFIVIDPVNCPGSPSCPPQPPTGTLGLDSSTAHIGPRRLRPSDFSTAIFDGRTLHLRLKCPARFKPRCSGSAAGLTRKPCDRRVRSRCAPAQQITLPAPAGQQAGRWRVARLRVKQRHRAAVSQMARRPGKKLLLVRQLVRARGFRGGRAQRVFHRYRVRSTAAALGRRGALSLAG